MAVTTVPHVSFPNHTTKGTGVTPTAGVSMSSGGVIPPVTDLLLLMSTGQFLLMSGANLLQVQ